LDSVGALSQEIELINKKQNNTDIKSLIPMKGESKIILSNVHTILIIYSLNAENDNIKLAINI
jgi:accessory gene regulator protein AgrB